ncbi:hypothetical protein AALO_G00302080, partial [Alosa alosa]
FGGVLCFHSSGWRQLKKRAPLKLVCPVCGALSSPLTVPLACVYLRTCWHQLNLLLTASILVHFPGTETT